MVHLLGTTGAGTSAAYNFVRVKHLKTGILDAGCGTGVGTEYLVHLNPAAFVVGIDLSASVWLWHESAAAGQELIESSSIISACRCSRLPGEFDLINCVVSCIICQIRGIQSLATKRRLGLNATFVYGNWGAGKLN